MYKEKKQQQQQQKTITIKQTRGKQEKAHFITAYSDSQFLRKQSELKAHLSVDVFLNHSARMLTLVAVLGPEMARLTNNNKQASIAKQQ